jgi:plasmid stability protein
MRTTLAIDDDLLRRLKQRATAEGTTLQALTNDLLRKALARERGRRDYRLKLSGWRASLQPGVDLLDRDSLWEAMDENVGGRNKR